MPDKHKRHKEDENSTASLKKKLHGDAESAITAELLEHPSYLELQKKLTETEEKATQHWERVLRIQAEMDNLSRRSERDISNAHKYALEKFVSALLPIVDNLERALTVSTDEGVSMTLKLFGDTLEKFGVQPVDPLGQPFNPELHQAISMQDQPDATPNTVLQVLQKGYVLNGRLVRPALVIVARST